MIAGKDVKKILKAAGIDTRKVSAVNERGSSIDVRIKDLEIDIDQVRALLAPFERVNRCEATGEILSGCNFFVFVKYDTDFIPEDLVDAYTLVYNMTNDADRNGSSWQYWGKRHMLENLTGRSEGQVAEAFYLCERKILAGY